MPKIKNNYLLNILICATISGCAYTNVKPDSNAQISNLNNRLAPKINKPKMSEIVQGVLTVFTLYGLSKMNNGPEIAAVYSNHKIKQLEAQRQVVVAQAPQ